MKKNIIKSALALIAVAAVGFGGYRAYSSYANANMSEGNLLLAEDIEALSGEEATCTIYYHNSKKILFQCVKKYKKRCSGTYSKWGQKVTISCDGVKVIG